jgi:methyl-accepting chemotaxis protein
MKLFYSMTFKIIMLSITGVLLTAVALIVSVILSENETEKIILRNRIQMEEQNKINMKTIAQGVYNSLRIYDKIQLSKLNDGMSYMRERFQAGGNLNQINAAMNFDPKEPSSIVDDVSRLHEVYATIFRKLEDGSMIRVSTSIVRDEKRFVNTKISPKNEDGSPNTVLQSVLRGNKYIGRTDVGGEWVNAIYEPIIEKGEVIGMLFVGSFAADTKNFIETIRNLNYGERGSVFAVGSKGVQKGILPISINGEMDYQNVWNLTNSRGEYYWRKIIETGSSLMGNSAEYLEADYRNKNGEEYKLALVEMYYAPWDWVIGVSIPKEEVEKASLEMQNSLIGSIAVLKKNIYFTGLTMFILVLIFSFILSKNLTRAIRQSIVLFDKIAKGDMTHRLEMTKDNMGEMATHFNKLMDNMHEFIKKVTHDASNLNMASEELFSVSGKVEDISNRIVMRSNMIASTTEQMVVVINVIASTVERMSTNMGNIAVTIKEMSQAINKITNNVEEIHQIAIGAKNKVTNATDVMGKLGTAAKEIGEVTEVIKRIAEKTNILALNATIEAAYAGEAGKGFAVVAAEIKDLANQSANSANYITQRIESIRNGTNNAVGVIRDVSGVIVKISNSVETITGPAERQITNTAITGNVMQTNAMAKRVADTIDDIAHNSSEISRNVNEVARGVANVNSNVVNMNQITEEIKQGSMRVHRKSEDLEKIATEFEEILSIYKV